MAAVFIAWPDRAALDAGLADVLAGQLAAETKTPSLIPAPPKQGLTLGAAIGSVASDQNAERFEAEPRHVRSSIDGLMAERFEEVALAGARRSAHDDVSRGGRPTASTVSQTDITGYGSRSASNPWMSAVKVHVSGTDTRPAGRCPSWRPMP